MTFHRLRSALAVGAGLLTLLATAATAPASAAEGTQLQLQVKYRGKCLTIANGSLRNGAHAIEGDCDSAVLHQVFRMRADDKPGWELAAAHSGRCLAYRPSQSAAVVQEWCNGSTAQRWSYEFLEGGEKNRLQLRPVDAPKECVTLGGTSPGEEPAAYVVECFDNMPSQEWRLAFVN
ncbi:MULTISPECIES: RICIN domain-containing protein [unclassified Streptomyces]|uniref:RICIN domain-containing protein n=1 Tax=unclassified Streptomyces TaxID=2593676 RepID=UPI0033B6B9CE